MVEMEPETRTPWHGVVGAVHQAMRGQTTGVIAARDGVIDRLDEGQQTSPYVEPEALTATERLARDIASGIREGLTLTALARRHGEDLVALSRMRHGYEEQTAYRRLQDFVYQHVYGKLIREDELPPRTQAALAAARRRRNASSTQPL